MVGMWGIANPASIVARTNMSRAAHGHTFDLSQVSVLGPDAVPAILASLGHINPATASQLRRELCSLSSGGTTFNLSRASARDDLARACGR